MFRIFHTTHLGIDLHITLDQSYGIPFGIEFDMIRTDCGNWNNIGAGHTQLYRTVYSMHVTLHLPTCI